MRYHIFGVISWRKVLYARNKLRARSRNTAKFIRILLTADPNLTEAEDILNEMAKRSREILLLALIYDMLDLKLNAGEAAENVWSTFSMHICDHKGRCNILEFSQGVCSLSESTLLCSGSIFLGYIITCGRNGTPRVLYLLSINLGPISLEGRLSRACLTTNVRDNNSPKRYLITFLPQMGH